MEIRLMGLDEECKTAIEAVQQLFVVVEVNGPYKNRDGSKLVRYFIHTRGPRLCPAESPSISSST